MLTIEEAIEEDRIRKGEKRSDGSDGINYAAAATMVRVGISESIKKTNGEDRIRKGEDSLNTDVAQGSQGPRFVCESAFSPEPDHELFFPLDSRAGPSRASSR